MALRSSNSASIASLKSKVSSWASSAQSYNDSKMADDYNNGLISPTEYISYLNKRMSSVAPGTTAYISWNKKLRNAELDRVQAPLEEGVKAGTVLPGDFAEWLSTNRLPELSVDSPKYAQMMNTIQSYEERQVSLEDVFFNAKYNEMKLIDERAADKAKVEYYASRIQRFNNPVKQAEATNTYNQVINESNKNQIRFAIKDMNRQIASMGSDTSAKAAYKYQQLQDLYTYAMENGLYEEADNLSTKLMNAQTAVQSAISAESSKKDAKLTDEEAAFKNYIKTINLTSRNAEDAAAKFLEAYENGWTATQEVVDDLGNKTVEQVQMPAYSTMLTEKIDKERKTYGDQWWAYNPTLAKEIAVMGDITDATKQGQMIDLSKLRKDYALTGNETYFPALAKMSNIPQLFNPDGSPKEMTGEDVDSYLNNPSEYFYQETGNRAYKKVSGRTYQDPISGELISKSKEEVEVGKKKYNVQTIKIGDKDFVVVPQEDGSEKIFDYDPQKQNPADLLTEMKTLESKAAGGDVTKDFLKQLGTYAIPGYGLAKLTGDIVGGVSGVKNSIREKAEEHKRAVMEAEAEKKRQEEAKRAMEEASKRNVAQQVTQQIQQPASLSPSQLPLTVKPMSPAKQAATQTKTTPITGSGGIDFQTASVITRDAQKMLSDWVGQGKPSFYTEKNIIPALAKQYGRDESEISQIVYQERKKPEYGGE